MFFAQTTGVFHAKSLYSLCKTPILQRCAQLWYAFFTPVVRLLHNREEGVPQTCAHHSIESQTNKEQVLQQRRANVCRIKYSSFSKQGCFPACRFKGSNYMVISNRKEITFRNTHFWYKERGDILQCLPVLFT